MAARQAHNLEVAGSNPAPAPASLSLLTRSGNLGSPAAQPAARFFPGPGP